MIWEFGVFFLTLLYLASLWLAYSLPAQFFWFSMAFLVVLLIGTRIIARKMIHFILPFFLTFSSALLIPLIDSVAQKKAFIVLSVGVFYLAILGSYRLKKYENDQTAKGMLNLVALATLFCGFAASYGWYLNIEMPVWLIMVIFAVFSFFVAFALIAINQLKVNGYQRFLYSVFLAYLMAGTIWMQDFWPFGYLTTAAVALIVYYSGWDLVRNYFLKKLTFQRVLSNVFFLFVMVTVLLLSAKWYPAA